MKIFSRFLFFIFLFNALTTFQAFSGPQRRNGTNLREQAKKQQITEIGYRTAESQASYPEMLPRRTLENGPVEQLQPSSIGTAREENPSNESGEEDMEALLQQKRAELEGLQQQLQLLENGNYVISLHNYSRLAALSNAFNISQNALRAAYQLRDYMFFYSQQGVHLGNDCYTFLDQIAKISEQNNSRAYANLRTFQSQMKNSLEAERYSTLIRDAFTKAESEISQLQTTMERVRSMTDTSDATTDDSTMVSSSSSAFASSQEKLTQVSSPTTEQFERENILRSVKKFINENQWYTRKNGKNVPIEDPTLHRDSSSALAQATIDAPSEETSLASLDQRKNSSTLAAPWEESKSEGEKTDDDERSTLPTALEQLHLKETSLLKTSKPKKEKKKKFKNPPSSPSSEELLEQKIRRNHCRINLAHFDYHGFQERCARLAEKIVTHLDAAEYAHYGPLISKFSTSFIEELKKLKTYNYLPADSDTKLIKQFKQMLHETVNQEYNEQFIQQKIASEKIFLKKREEAAAVVLAELEAEEAQQKLLTNQTQGKKKTAAKKK